MRIGRQIFAAAVVLAVFMIGVQFGGLLMHAAHSIPTATWFGERLAAQSQSLVIRTQALANLSAHECHGSETAIRSCHAK